MSNLNDENGEPTTVRSKTKERKKSDCEEKADPGVTCRKVKFSQTGIDLLHVLKTKFPGATISGIVLMGLKALLKAADAAPVIRYMRLPAKEVIRLRAILAEARASLEKFRDDLLVARGTPEMLAPLASRTEEAMDKVEMVADEVAQLIGVAQPTPEEIDQLELAVVYIQHEIDLPDIDDTVRDAFRCAIKYLGIQLPTPP